MVRSLRAILRSSILLLSLRLEQAQLVTCGLIEEPDVERLLGFAGYERLRDQKRKPVTQRHGRNARYQELLANIGCFAQRRGLLFARRVTSTSAAGTEAFGPNASRKSAAFEALPAARKMARLSSRSTFSHDPR